VSIYGHLAPSKNELNLFGDFYMKKLLEIGCGNGHSLEYLHENGASELWRLDLSGAQIDTREGMKTNYRK
jgi:hypothetical protein